MGDCIIVRDVGVYIGERGEVVMLVAPQIINFYLCLYLLCILCSHDMIFQYILHCNNLFTSSFKYIL